MTKELHRLISSAKFAILRYLETSSVCSRRKLEPYVLSVIDIKEKKDGTVVHAPRPIHGLAFILAYKELENEGNIKIDRSKDVLIPMTDYETIFVKVVKP